MFKTGKTLLAIDGTISIGTGRPFLNRFAVPEPMAVVYFSGEGGPSMVQEYAAAIAASKGLRLSDLFNVSWCFSVPRLEDGATWTRFNGFTMKPRQRSWFLTI